MYSKKTYTLEEATKKLEHYCAYQERCHQEVRKKLEGMHMIPEAIDLIIVHLLKHNFLNEERFAKTFVNGKFKIKRWGRNRLIYELNKKDIGKVNINQALAEIESTDYIEVFNNLAEKKANSIKETNVYKKRKKLIDYLLYRGWESHLVYEKANELIK
ncbi:RecX family transcriptional regulator [Sabulilitoribacter arenilitoris]|uniref:Regulatory protein RecX n=1 Tax=Wocania arenilitoris TaxID=2044858 RepID=A0AAE3EJW8_9FLAO|nr:regulatory protein RecX [Wocania arenilitoris]MCF7566896.1 RecX family transcriptional regulator [Wocania arenilitoris]